MCKILDKRNGQYIFIFILYLWPQKYIFRKKKRKKILLFEIEWVNERQKKQKKQKWKVSGVSSSVLSTFALVKKTSDFSFPPRTQQHKVSVYELNARHMEIEWDTQKWLRWGRENIGSEHWLGGIALTVRLNVSRYVGRVELPDLGSHQKVHSSPTWIWLVYSLLVGQAAGVDCQSGSWGAEEERYSLPVP